MKKFSILSAVLIGMSLMLAAPADAAGNGQKPSSSSRSSSPQKSRGKAKIVKNVPQATADAGNMARARRGRGQALPQPKPKAGPSARNVSILLPGATKPVRPGQKATAAEVIAARRAVRASSNIIPLQSPSGATFDYRRGGRRFSSPPLGSAPGARASGASEASAALPRLRRDANGRLIDRTQNSGAGPSNRN